MVDTDEGNGAGTLVTTGTERAATLPRTPARPRSRLEKLRPDPAAALAHRT
jgi:hypothetical protein